MQERELAAKRTADGQRQAIAGVRQEMQSLLESIKTQEICTDSDIDAAPAGKCSGAIISGAE
jgi:hypothetical protein